MPTLQLIITDAGRQAIVDATNTGTLPVVLSQIALGTGKWSPDATANALQAEIKRVDTVGGLAVADDTIHVTCTDDSIDAYALGEFGLYTDGGVLFAIYSDLTGIADKAADALLLLAADVVLTSVPPGSVTVNGIGFSNPPATESAPGIAELATQAETDAGADDGRIVTPKKLMAAASSSSIANALVRRDASGNFRTNQPVHDNDVPRKVDVDTVQQNLDIHKNDGGAHGATSAATANAIIRRDAAGRAKVAAPSADDDIARLDTVLNAIAALVGASPGTLDTLNELAAALGDDPNFATTMTNALAGKMSIGAFGLGANTLPLVGDANNRLLPSGWYGYHEPSGSTGGPVSYGVLLVSTEVANAVSYPTWANQIFFGTDGKIYHRTAQTTTTWYSWKKLYTDNNSSTLADANTLILRDASGRAKVAAPSASDDIARKAEVDAALDAAQFPSGTIMLFGQSAAPTGWTKLTDQNDKALRVVSGVAGVGGTVAFSTAFAANRAVSSVAAGGSIGTTTLTQTQIPAHYHIEGLGAYTSTNGGGRYGWTGGLAQVGFCHTSSLSTTGAYTSSIGSGGAHGHSFTGDAHNHTLDMAVQYVDVIRAQKD